MIATELDEVTGAPAEWRDKRRLAWALGLVVPAFPFIGYGLVRFTGLPLFWWIGPLFAFVMVPFLDAMLGKNAENPPESALRRLETDSFYRRPCGL